LKNDKNDNLVTAEQEQMWCNKDQRFLSDRFILVGT